jgi:manganese/zinc/iron transport system substrate-binding protein
MAPACGRSGHEKKDPHQWMTPNGKIKVLSTTAMIGGLVDRIGGENIDNLVLIMGELDPHSYQLVKGDDEKLKYAHVIFYNGLGLEHGPSLQKYLKNNSNAHALGNLIKTKKTESILQNGGQSDPHLWMDVLLWSEAIPFIVEALSVRDPDHRETYQANGKALVQDLKELHEKIYLELQEIPPSKRYLVTSHDAFSYFAKAYLAADGERENEAWRPRFDAPEGIAPESQLSTAHIRGLISHLKKYQIPVIFPESNVSRDSLKKIVNAGSAEGIRIKIAEQYLYGDAMGSPGTQGDTYEKMMKYNAETIARYLKEN